ncbi:BBE domain-containing protein [Heracleum sosnowskyi]|uniref:BBE domain-containing protein n=1 Tax=Heracleum sosnowskyi TaxID=360622 RepID=A0AAD8HWV3_9APIA|nr:BBE domain-containing protein [Heracleum sosnowskyi]
MATKNYTLNPYGLVLKAYGLRQTSPPKLYIKAKSDYVQQPISKDGLEQIWKRLMEMEQGATNLVMTPYGGKMSRIPEESRLAWLRSLSNDLTPYVSSNPRRSYVNYNDLDLGVGNTTYAEASTWGTRYFNNNFKRLVQVKNRLDAENLYLHEQSIPPFALT